MNTMYRLLTVALAIGLLGCGSSNEGQEKEPVRAKVSTDTNCGYAYNATESEFSFTAFKFNERAGVGGTFDQIEVSGTEEAENRLDAVRNLQFNIPINSINTANSDRDMKIATYFFGTLTGTDNLTGKVVELNEDGTMSFEITMNETSGIIDGTYAFSGDTMLVKSNIDVAKWGAETGINALNEICYDLHKGRDGVSKLWTDVDLSIKAVINKPCL
jgi:polyisoprenoid-binding protein YceI